MELDLEDTSWKAVGALAAIGAATLARNGLQDVWRRTRRREPPANPASPDVDWGEAIMWAALTGAVIGVARMVASRWAAEGWRQATGTYPRGLQDVQ